MFVVQFEAARLPAALPPFIDVAATFAVPLRDLASHVSRDVPAALARVGAPVGAGLRGLLRTGLLRHGVLALLQIGNQEAHRAEVDRLERSPTVGASEEIASLIQEAHVFVLGRELDLVALRPARERLLDGWRCVLFRSARDGLAAVDPVLRPLTRD